MGEGDLNIKNDKAKRTRALNKGIHASPCNLAPTSLPKLDPSKVVGSKQKADFLLPRSASTGFHVHFFCIARDVKSAFACNLACGISVEVASLF